MSVLGVANVKRADLAMGVYIDGSVLGAAEGSHGMVY
jgi:hypothetical protein